MDEAELRACVQAHADAVVDPLDLEHLKGDLVPELHAALPRLAEALPTPVRSARVDHLAVDDGGARARITYTGASGAVTITSRWEDRGAGRPQVVAASPVT